MRYSNGTACMIQSDWNRSAVVSVGIDTRDWTEVMIADKVDMGNSPFAQKFFVLSKDPAAVKEIVNDSIQSIMLEHSKKATRQSC